jgi:hypothetical protein
MGSDQLTVGWVGDGAPRMEVARVRHHGREVVADGMQLGQLYGLRYHVEPGLLTVQLVGAAPRGIELGDADFFDLAWSPLFNSLPVLRDGLLDAGRRRTYRMRWVDVPSLQAELSQQVYEPHGDGTVGFRAGDFAALIQFDEDGFVRDYPGIARRI